MASRRINSSPYFQNQQDFPKFDLEALNNLQDEEDTPVDFASIMNQLSSPMQVADGFQFPSIPQQSLGQDLPGVDDVPGIPEGIELLGDLQGFEAEEDFLDSFSETSPIPLESYDDLQGVGDMPYQEDQQGFIPDSQIPLEEEIQFEDIQQPIAEGQLPRSVEMATNLYPVDPSEITQESIEQISQEGMDMVPGSVEMLRTDENVLQEANRILNIGGITPEIFDRSILLQNLFDKKEAEYTAQEKQLKESMETGKMTTFDKVSLGLAIVAPIIIGMMYGKEAFLGGVAGGLEGFSKGKEAEGKQLSLKSKQLSELQDKKDNLIKGRADLKKEIAGNVENPKLRQFIKDRDFFESYKDGNEVKVRPGKNTKIFGDKLGFSSGDEGKILYYHSPLLSDDEDVAHFKKVSRDANEAMGRIKDSNSSIDDVVDLMKAVKDQHPTIYSAIMKGILPTENSLLGSLNFLSKDYKDLSIDYVDKDGKVTTVKALPLMQQKMGALQDSYNKQYLGRGILTKGVQDHWTQIFPDMASLKSWIGSDYPTMLKQANEFKNTLNKRAIEEFVASGFIRDPIEEALNTNQGQYLEATSSAMRDIEENPDKYKSLYVRPSEKDTKSRDDYKRFTGRG